MATISRVMEIELFLEALKHQSYQSFELIIVDQNLDDRLNPLVKSYQDVFPIKHIKSSSPGLSRNRNIGIAQSTGNIIAFPDDDCIYYDTDTLKNVVDFFANNSYDIFTFNTVDKESGIPVVGLMKDSVEINRNNIFHTSISFTIFLKNVKAKHLHFDEKLGVGAAFGSAEESDLIYNLLASGYKGYYQSSLFIHHPSKIEKLNAEKGYNYGLGLGALFKKNVYQRHYYADVFTFSLFIVKPIIKILLLNNIPFYWNTLKGRVKGFIKYK